MKIQKIFIGVAIILLAIFGILSAAGVIGPVESFVGEVSLFQIIGGLLLILLLIKSILVTKIGLTVILLSLLFMVFESNIAVVCGLEDHNIINNWLLLLFVLLICVGIKLILPKNRLFWNKTTGKPVISGVCGGSNEVYIDCESFVDKFVENNMGSTVIKFENPDLYIGDGVLRVENNMGSMTIYVPTGWKLEANIEKNMGSVSNRVGVGEDGPKLTIVGENNMGSISILKK